MKTNVLILSSEPCLASNFPDCLQEYKGVTLLEYICRNTLPTDDCEYNFVFCKDAIRRHHLDNVAKILIPGANVMHLPGDSMGSACTALYAASTMEGDYPLLIVSTNEIVDIQYVDAISYFSELNIDAGVMTFESVHPRYSYVKLANGCAIEFAQQNPISAMATAGSFWFRKTSDFIDAAKQSILKNTRVSRRYYVAPVLNQMILGGKLVKNYDVDGRYIPMKRDNYLVDLV